MNMFQNLKGRLARSMSVQRTNQRIQKLGSSSIRLFSFQVQMETAHCLTGVLGNCTH